MWPHNLWLSYVGGVLLIILALLRMFTIFRTNLRGREDSLLPEFDDQTDKWVFLNEALICSNEIRKLKFRIIKKFSLKVSSNFHKETWSFCQEIVFPSSGCLNVNELLSVPFLQTFRYDILTDGLEDVAVDNNMNKQTTLEDEEALDPIDEIWQEDDAEPIVPETDKLKYKLRPKSLTKPYVTYELLKSNCDSLRTWSVSRSLKK